MYSAHTFSSNATLEIYNNTLKKSNENIYCYIQENIGNAIIKQKVFKFSVGDCFYSGGGSGSSGNCKGEVHYPSKTGTFKIMAKKTKYHTYYNNHRTTVMNVTIIDPNGHSETSLNKDEAEVEMTFSRDDKSVKLKCKY